MASGDEQVQLDILVDIRDAIKALDTFEKKGEQVAEKTTSAFDSIKAAAGVAVAVFGSAAIANFFSEGIDSAIKQQSAMAALEQQLELTGDASEGALDTFKSMADELEASTGIADDAILQNIALAKSFGITNDQAGDLVKAATELSAVTGKDLNNSVRTLGKTFSGVAGPLDDQIAGFEQLTKAQLASGAAIDLVLDRFGGTAAAKMQTFAGAVTGVKNAFGNLQEAFGEVVVNSPVLITAIGELTKAISGTQELVSENTSGFDSLVVAVVEVTNVLAQGFLGAIEYVNSGLEFLTRILGGIPLLLAGAGSNAIAGAAEFAAEGLASLGLITNETAAGISGKFRAAATSVNALDGQIEKFFDNTQRGADKLQKGIQDSTDRIAGADGKQAKSAEDAAKRRAAAAQRGQQSAADLAKAIEEGSKLQSEVAKLNQSAIDAEITKRDELLAKITANEKAGGLATTVAAQLRIEVTNKTGDKILELEQAQYDQSVEKAKKAAADIRAEIQSAAANPIEFIISGKKITSDAGIAIGAGITDNILDGAAGAQKLLSAGVGAAADAFIPGLGGAASGIFDALSQGPDATKAMVKGFVEAIPDIITAVAESMPVVVEALVDSLINDGGLIKIAIALGKALVGEAIFKAIGEQLGLSFGDAFNLQNIGGTITKGFEQGVSKLAAFITNIPPAFKAAATEVAIQLQAAVGNALAPLTDGFRQAGEVILTVLQTPIQALKGLAGPIIAAFRPFSLGVEFLSRVVSRLNSTPRWVEALFDGFQQVADFFADLFDFGGAGSAIGLASGIKEVPAGFPNDSFPAMLTSGERVVSVPQNRDLTQFLDNPAPHLDGAGAADDRVVALLSQIASQMAKGNAQGMASVELKIDGRTLAKELVNLDRRNVRTTA